MTQFVPFLYTSVAAKVPLTSWTDLQDNESFLAVADNAPEFDCSTFEKIEFLDPNSLGVVGVANKARAGGVDTNNINGIVNEFRARGYRADRFPPVLMILPSGEIELWDGYNRVNAAKLSQVSTFPFAIYRLKESWAECLEDAYDQVSLGLNNHAQCKPATIQDFVTRGIDWVNRHENENEKTKSEIIAWVNSISHSWTNKQVESIASKIYQSTTVATTIIPYTHPAVARSWVAENWSPEVSEDSESTEASTNPLVVCCKETGYIERAVIQMMRNFVGTGDKEIDVTDLLFYTKGCETVEQVQNQRTFGTEYFAELVDLIIAYGNKVHNYTKRGEDYYRSYNNRGALPQLNNIEDPESVADLPSEKQS